MQIVALYVAVMLIGMQRSEPEKMWIEEQLS